MNDNSFFDESTEQSQVKSRIVEKYFWAWAQVMKGWANKIGYIDLFAGPGRYQDGSKSTPILVLEKAIEEEDIRNRLVSVFNDLNQKYTESLQSDIDSIPDIKNLKHEPTVINEEVGEKIVEIFEQMNTIPTLFFVDPWGYKGLSLQLISAVLKSWGCDCIFFFNYNRINMGISNQAVKEHMDALFGSERAEELRAQLLDMNPHERELTIVEAISQALKEEGGGYVLPFCFKIQSGSRSSHHLIFVSKHIRGYQIMKGIMARESSTATQGVPSFEYNPAATPEQPLLFELSRPLDDLANMLLMDFAGKRRTMKQIYEQHNIGKPYIPANYKDVLAKLELDGKIRANPPAEERPKRKDKVTQRDKVTFADHVAVTFPPGSE